MKKVALTGSMAAGKSTVATMFAELGVPVFDADAVVRKLYASGGAAVEPLRQLVPAVVSPDGGVNRVRLSEEVMKDPELLRKVEEVVHPLVDIERKTFLDRARRKGAPYVVLEEPLLMEKGREREYDLVVTVHAPRDVRIARALNRPNMTEEKFSILDARQLPDMEKRDRADFVIETSGTLEDVRRQVRKLHRKILGMTDSE